ncbi:LacI family DNA-binding transcriptional regulator [Bradyrhizobium sp. HKCCYLRH3061]|uniref:LacI family DNA-binding transcriptional regulator n=1 Tax=Bradyrhizobium sp. HKCCYLRH3061 TaxID=3420734 RepID=UPI003EB9D7D1
MTLEDGARIANVSAVTVSRVLRRPDMVSPQLRKRIDAAGCLAPGTGDDLARARRGQAAENALDRRRFRDRRTRQHRTASRCVVMIDESQAQPPSTM